MTDSITESTSAPPTLRLTVAAFNDFRFVFVEGVLTAVSRKGAGYFNEDFVDDSELMGRVLRAVGNAPLTPLRGQRFAQSVAYLLAYYQQSNPDAVSTED